MTGIPKSVVPLEEIEIEEAHHYGGKAANLTRLHSHGFLIPRGFSISGQCFEQMLTDIPKIVKLMNEIEVNDDIETNMELAIEIQSLIEKYELSDELRVDIVSELQKLKGKAGTCEYGFAIRSSATVEDTETVSFAGQAESFLCIKSPNDVISCVKNTWASALTPTAILYLKSMNVPISRMRMGVVVQEMIRAEVSGVMFTTNVVENNSDQILIESTIGLGEPLVAGKIKPDTFLLDKESLQTLEKILGTKEKSAIPVMKEGEIRIEFLDTPVEKRNSFSLDDESLIRVAQLGLDIERKMGSPQDIEWCVRGQDIVVLQTRPITTLQ